LLVEDFNMPNGANTRGLSHPGADDDLVVESGRPMIIDLMAEYQPGTY
jgi:hypothetical protein